MHLVIPIRNHIELKAAREAGAHEVLLGHLNLSTLGNLNSKTLNELAASAAALGLRPVVLWDILMLDREFDHAIKTLSEINLSQIAAIRVLDPGALEYTLQETRLPVQLILRTGHHNIESVLSWSEYNSRIQKIILSSELPQKRIAEYTKRIQAEVEVLGLAPILLFYSPRFLLSHQLKISDSDTKTDDSNSTSMLTALASCDEDNHNGFRVIETPHGTLMYHSKDYCLIDVAHELKNMGVSAFQVDLRLEKNENVILEQLSEISKLFCDFIASASNSQVDPPVQQSTAFAAWVDAYPAKITRCFYRANATDKLFKNLKNSKIQRIDESFVGEVVESVKGKHIIIYVMSRLHKLSKGAELKILTPMGKHISHTIHRLWDLDGNEIDEAHPGEYAVLHYLKSVTPTSVVYKIANIPQDKDWHV